MPTLTVKATTFPQLDWRSKLCYAVRRPEPDSRGVRERNRRQSLCNSILHHGTVK